MDENKFREPVRKALAQRAGYMCSLCGKLTVGPSKESDISVALLGDAAHIASVKPKGKRYVKDMDPKDRRDIKNGIWLCKDHHKLVDSDECEYTKSFLYTIKRNHEKRVSFLNSGIKLDYGLVVGVQIENIGRFIERQNVEFSNSTVLLAKNATGKTLLCDIVSSISSIDKIKKWIGEWRVGNSNYKVSYFDKSLTEYGVNINSRNEISYSFNGDIVPAFLSPYYCLYLDNDFLEFTKEIDDIDSKLAAYFKLEKTQINELINFISKLEKTFLNEMLYEENTLKVRISPRSPLLNFSSLSSGEKYRVILELALLLSKYYSKYLPTVLIIEHSSFSSMDYAGVNKLLKSVLDKKINFQFIFTSHHDYENFDIKGHQCYLLKGGDNDTVKIEPLNYG